MPKKSAASSTPAVRHGLLIDPASGTVTSVPAPDYESMRQHLGCTTLEEFPMRLPDGDFMYCDEEFLFAPVQGGVLFFANGGVLVAINRLIVFGTDPATGATVSPKITAGAMREKVSFIPVAQAAAAQAQMRAQLETRMRNLK